MITDPKINSKSYKTECPNLASLGPHRENASLHSLLGWRKLVKQLKPKARCRRDGERMVLCTFSEYNSFLYQIAHQCCTSRMWTQVGCPSESSTALQGLHNHLASHNHSLFQIALSSENRMKGSPLFPKASGQCQFLKNYLEFDGMPDNWLLQH